MIDRTEGAQPAICIVPCSGIGKTYGTVTREAAYLVTAELRPNTTRVIPLSLLVLGDEEAREAVQAAPVLTLDGCKLACATHLVRQSGGVVAQDFTVLDTFRKNRALKPAGIAELNEGGLALARALAEEVAAATDAAVAATDAAVAAADAAVAATDAAVAAADTAVAAGAISADRPAGEGGRDA